MHYIETQESEVKVKVKVERSGGCSENEKSSYD